MSIKERHVPILRASIVLHQAVFLNMILFLIVALTISKDEDNVEVLALNDGHIRKVPISPPYRLIVYPL